MPESARKLVSDTGSGAARGRDGAIPRSRDGLRARKAALSREHILNAAEELLAKGGIQGTTIKDIAEASEFSVRTIYSHFESKERLVEGVFVRHGRALIDQMIQVHERHLDAKEELHELLDVSIDYLVGHPTYAHLYAQATEVGLGMVMQESPPSDRGLQGTYRDALVLHCEVFEKGVRSGTFIGIEPSRGAIMFFGLSEGYLASVGFGIGETKETRHQLHDLVDRAFLLSS